VTTSRDQQISSTEGAITVDHQTPFEHDIAEQPEALRRLAATRPAALGPLLDERWERIVLTGMGSSHFAGLPTWRALTELGIPAWAIDTGQLLDAPALVTPRTALIVTSQSGASGEVVELVGRRAAGDLSAGLVVGIADDRSSPLAESSDLFIPLHSGPESTVSTKSYLNTLAVHRQLIGAFRRTSPDSIRRQILDTADAVERVLADDVSEEYGQRAADHQQRRVAFVGWADDGATAQFAGLITKEASKVPAEGFVGGQFRHGPFELAGDGMTAVLFGPGSESMSRLSRDLLRAGATVIVVGPDAGLHPMGILAPYTTPLQGLSSGAVVAQKFAVGLARGNGYVPGAFLHGSKVTTAL